MGFLGTCCALHAVCCVFLARVALCVVRVACCLLRVASAICICQLHPAFAAVICNCKRHLQLSFCICHFHQTFASVMCIFHLHLHLSFASVTCICHLHLSLAAVICIYHVASVIVHLSVTFGMLHLSFASIISIYQLHFTCIIRLHPSCALRGTRCVLFVVLPLYSHRNLPGPIEPAAEGYPDASRAGVPLCGHTLQAMCNEYGCSCIEEGISRSDLVITQ